MGRAPLAALLAPVSRDEERLAEQDAKIRNVSAQLELSQSRPQTVLNERWPVSHKQRK
jgi:hypothetical protein